MISRLTAAATAFAILATGSLALAASGHSAGPAAPTVSKAATVIQLPLVVVVGTRGAANAP